MSNRTATQIAAGYTSTDRAVKQVLFIDVQAEVSDEDVQALEGAGFLVVKIVGSPRDVVAQFSLYGS
jgi:hypothetical protein